VALGNEIEINLSNLSKKENCDLLNRNLSEENLLNYFKAREKILSMPYEEITQIRELTKNTDSMQALNKLLDSIISKKENEGVYLLQEDIFVNNIPQLLDSPFCFTDKKEHNISELTPYAEHIYFDNLKLTYKVSNLLEKTEGFFINPEEYNDSNKRKLLPQAIKRIDTFRLESLANKATGLWSYVLEDDNLNNFLFDSRQWFKRYEENAIRPIIYKGTVILRNEYRLFCLELSTGRQIWSFGSLDTNGYEHYQTYRHPHHNAYGYELFLGQNTIYTELSGKLVAVTIEDIFKPKFVWEHDLGEYTVCTSPISSNGILMVGLINAKGEFWIVGFDSKEGVLKWNIYIGTTSFLSPVCEMSISADYRVFIATNHGVLICLNSINGKIIWIRKYSPKNYSLFDYLHKSYYNETSSGSGFISYDTQFLELDDNNFLYYKPRESDYLYTINTKNGEVKDKILIDSDNYYILRGGNGKGILLNKTGSKDTKLKIIDLQSGAQLDHILIKNGKFKGVNYINNEEMLIKLDNTLHYLKIQKNKINHKQINSFLDGWLLNSSGRFIFIAKNRTLSCEDTSKQIGRFYESPYKEYLEQRKSIKKNFIKAIQLDPTSKELTQLINKLLVDIKASNLPLNDFSPLILNNLEQLKQPNWNYFFSELKKYYVNEVITYKDVEIKFVNFLSEVGLIDPIHKVNSANYNKDRSFIGKNNFKARGEKIFLLPVNVVKGSKAVDFFLLLNNDQLLCVNEEGSIRWNSKTFYNVIINAEGTNYATDKNKGRLYTGDIEAFLYDDILIINDRVNIIGIDVSNGTYIWSMTNKGESFLEQKQLPLKEQDRNLLFRNYGVKRSFLKNVMFYTKFIGNQLLIVHGNKIYSINPVTGFCNRYSELNIEGIIDIAISGERIYLLSYFLDNLLVLDKDFKEVGKYSLNFIENKEGYPQLIIVNDYIVIHVNSCLYFVDIKNGLLKSKFSLGHNDRNYIESYKNNLLSIVPFQKVNSYRIEDGSLIVDWELNISSDGPKIFPLFGQASRYYFIIDGQILLPFSNKGNYYFLSVELDTGKKRWKRYIRGVEGLFHNLSDYQNLNGIINFIISTVHTGEEPKSNAELKPDKTVTYIKSYLLGLDLNNGKILKNKKLSNINFRNAFENTILIKTKNYFAYVIYGNFLQVEKIK